LENLEIQAGSRRVFLEAANRPVGKFSTGMRKRLEAVMALLRGLGYFSWKMSLMFVSTSLFLRQFLPERLKAVSAVNPLTYLMELGRDAMTYGTLIYLTAFSAALVLVERLLTAD
jgi:hypothetical protein